MKKEVKFLAQKMLDKWWEENKDKIQQETIKKYKEETFIEIDKDFFKDLKLEIK